MDLNRRAREYYELKIITVATDGDPIPASGWEASFDGGATWEPTTVITHDDGDWSAWLLAGPDADEGTAVAVITARAKPLVRAIDNPEIIVRKAPQITLST